MYKDGTLLSSLNKKSYKKLKNKIKNNKKSNNNKIKDYWCNGHVLHVLTLTQWEIAIAKYVALKCLKHLQPKKFMKKFRLQTLVKQKINLNNSRQKDLKPLNNKYLNSLLIIGNNIAKRLKKEISNYNKLRDIK